MSKEPKSISHGTEMPDARREIRAVRSQNDVLHGVRHGGAAELRRALVQAESGNVQLPTIRGVLSHRLCESLSQPGLSGNVREALLAAKRQIDNSESVDVPFSSDGTRIEVVTVPFSIRD